MGCSHIERVPVETLVDGDVTVVAQQCLTCDKQLDAGYGCPDCEWVTVSSLAGDRWDFVTEACPAHAHIWERAST